jgi:hypothetical protein
VCRVPESLADCLHTGVQCYTERAMRPVQCAIGAIVLVSLAGGSVACQSLIRLEDRYLASDGAVDCPHSEPPPPPQIISSSSSIGDLVFAVTTAEFGTDSVEGGVPLYQTLGFDLDQTCTGEGQGPSCVEPSSAVPNEHDGDAGIDNAYGKLVFGSAMGTIDTVNARAILFRIRGYDGDPDDEQVEVCLYVAYGLEPRLDGGGPFWDGQDRWMIASDTLLSPGVGLPFRVDQPRYCDEHAYVSSSVLVAHLDEARFPSIVLLAPTYLSRAHHVVMAGHLVRAAGVWELQNTMIGFRASVPDALTYGSQGQMLTGGPYCMDSTSYMGIKQRICSVVDITVDPSPPSAPCDALSVGFSLEARLAQLGEVSDASSDSLAPCAPGIKPQEDNCGP